VGNDQTRPGKLTVVCVDWRPLHKASLRGFARIHIVELALIINDVAIHESHGKLWAAPPTKPWIKDGALILGDNGRPQYSPILEFQRAEVRSAFSQRVIEAVNRFDPKALAMEGAA
jgi:hypothetical protein